MTQPLISVIVPIYNVESYLLDCLNSLMNQTFSSYEIILVNDGSTDTSLSLAREFIERCDATGKIHLLTYSVNVGQAEARNRGIRQSRGDFIVFVDSDDLVAPTYLEVLYDLIEGDKTAIGMTHHTADFGLISLPDSSVRKVLSRVEGLRLLFGSNHAPWGKIYPKSFFDTVSFPRGEIYEDFATVYRLFLQASRVVYQPIKTYYYRQRQGSTMHSTYTDRNLVIIKQGRECLKEIEAALPEVLPDAAQMVFNALLHHSLNELTYGEEYSKLLWREGIRYRSRAKGSQIYGKSLRWMSFLGYSLTYWFNKYRRKWRQKNKLHIV